MTLFVAWFLQEGVFSSMVEFSLDVKDIILEFQAAKGYFDDILSIMDEFFQLLSTVSSTLTVSSGVKAISRQ